MVAGAAVRERTSAVASAGGPKKCLVLISRRMDDASGRGSSVELMCRLSEIFGPRSLVIAPPLAGRSRFGTLIGLLSWSNTPAPFLSPRSDLK